MASFPTSIPSIASVSSGDTLAAANHASKHNAMKDEIIALATKVGVDSSAVTSTHDYKLSGVTGSDKAASVTGAETLSNKTLTSASLTSPTITTPTVTNPTITGGGSWSGSPTITTPTIASFANASHDHTNSAGGGVLGTSALAANAVTYATAAIATYSGSQGITSTSFTDITSFTGSVTTHGGSLIVMCDFSFFKDVGAFYPDSYFKILIGSNEVPGASGWLQYTNEYSSHKPGHRTFLVNGIGAGTYTVKLQGRTVTSGTLSFDLNDYCYITILELLR